MARISKSNFQKLKDKVGPLVRRKESSLTFAARHGVVPHHVAVLEDARDGLRAVRFDESLLTQEGDGTAQLKVLTETLPIHWHTRVWALVVTEGWRGGEVEEVNRAQWQRKAKR